LHFILKLTKYKLKNKRDENMKVLTFDKFKPKFVSLTYDILERQKRECEKKGYSEDAYSYSKLLAVLNIDSSEEFIENKVNKIISKNREMIKENSEEIKRLKEINKLLEGEIALLSNYSEKEMSGDSIAMILTASE
jgi:hypothetical protein